jgi:hypothetical protein
MNGLHNQTLRGYVRLKLPNNGITSRFNPLYYCSFSHT